MIAKRKQLLQAGDTIIEVLIAMTVAGSVLSVSLSTMNRNLAITRNNQERTEASKIAQAQIEAIKVATDTGTPTIPPVNTPFCFPDNGTSIGSVTATVLNGNPHTDMMADTFADYGQCVSGFYNYVIVRTGTSDYSIYVRWDQFSGKSRDQIIMAYRT